MIYIDEGPAGRLLKLQCNFISTRLSPNPSASSRAWLDAIAKYTENKSKICAMGVFRSQTPRAYICSSKIPLIQIKTSAILMLWYIGNRGSLVITCSDSCRCRSFFLVSSYSAFPPLAFADLDINVRKCSA